MARVLSPETIAAIEKLYPRYPTRMAVLIPALHLAQHQIGHISEAVELDLAELLDVPPTRVREVATFYTMFHTEPAGRHTVRICRNLSCQLRGAERIMQKAREVLKVRLRRDHPRRAGSHSSTRNASPPAAPARRSGVTTTS